MVNTIHTYNMTILRSTNPPKKPESTLSKDKTTFSDVLDNVNNDTNLSETGETTDVTSSELEDIFVRASKKYNVSLNLLKAVAKAESDFQADCISSSGAVGIMQLMPETAKELGVTDRYDVEQNIMGGAKLLSENLKYYDGDVSLALAAYNAGRGAVKKYDGIPPYTETQNYVKKVLNYSKSTIQIPA